MPVGGDDGWTDARIEALKTYWAEGLSASQIALKLGGVTRNGVVGKVHRLGLSGRQRRAGGGRAGLPAADLEVLKRLWDADVSVARIAAELGFPNTATVYYYANREGLPPRKRAASSNTVPPQPNRWHAARGIEPETKPLADEPDVQQSMAFPIVLGTAAAVIDLHENPFRCGWPIGNPGAADFHYCTNRREASGSRYCVEHATQAYQPLVRRHDLARKERWARENPGNPDAQRILAAVNEKRSAWQS